MLFAAGLLCAAWAGPAAAQDNLLVGTWQGEDPASGEKGEIIITDNTLQFGEGEPEIPYTARGSGGHYEIFIGGPGNPPATFSFSDADHGTFAIPGGPSIPLTRLAAAAAPAPAETAAPAPEGAPQGLMDEMLAIMVPHGVNTRFEPLKQSLEALLAEGWQLDQAGGASGGFTLLLSKGQTRALCMLVPRDMGQADTAVSDCRRLN
jgi:hypothetical protein